jgi:hypothetical protein
VDAIPPQKYSPTEPAMPLLATSAGYIRGVVTFFPGRYQRALDADPGSPAAEVGTGFHKSPGSRWCRPIGHDHSAQEKPFQRKYTVPAPVMLPGRSTARDVARGRSRRSCRSPGRTGAADCRPPSRPDRPARWACRSGSRGRPRARRCTSSSADPSRRARCFLRRPDRRCAAGWRRRGSQGLLAPPGRSKGCRFRLPTARAGSGG